MLCEFCKTLNSDAACSKQGAEHHESWSKMCISADAGCELCMNIRACHYAIGDHCDPEARDAPVGGRRIRCFYDIYNSWLLWAFKPFETSNRISSIHVCTASNDSMSKLLWSRQPSSDTRSDAFFSQMHNWISTCMTKHEICRSDGGSFWETVTGSQKRRELSATILPTRVVDVGGDQTSPSLYISHGTSGRWLALSHCWGSHQPLKLESRSITTFTNAIPLGIMPPFFRDAVLITRRLGFRYLWIDSLCIVQDSREDWLTGSLKLGDIYKNVVFTIAAEAAEDCSAGILSSTARGRTSESDQQSRDVIKVSAYSATQSVEGTLVLTKNSAMKTMPSNHGPLSARKWVLQEEILSTRLLRFSEGLVWWQCRELQCNERFPYGYRARNNLGDKNRVHVRNNIEWASIKSFTLTSRRGKTQKRGNNVMRLVNQQQVRWYWYDTVNECCSRHMSYDTDLLPAISGIMKEYQRQLLYDSSSYKAGMWQDDLVSGLLWYTPRQGATTASPHVAPSWSWASIRSGSYYSRQLLDDLLHEDFLTSLFAPRPRPQAVVNVLEVSLTMQQEEPFGQVQGGFMRLQGPSSELCRCSIPHYFLDCFTMTEDFVLRYSEIREMLKNARKDTTRNSTNVCNLSEFTASQSCDLYADTRHDRCLAVHVVSSKRFARDQKIAFALISERVEGSDDRYRRIGLAMLLEDIKSSKQWSSRTMIII